MILRVMNIHIVWRPMSLSESGMQKSSVADQHVEKCVKACLGDIRSFKSQNNMGTG